MVIENTKKLSKKQKAEQEMIQEGLIPEKKIDYNKNFILDEKELPQMIDHAVGKIKINNKELRYYGTRLSEQIEKLKGEDKYTIIKENPAIILEDGRIISKINRNIDDLNFNFKSEAGIKNRWSLNSIKEFCDEKRRKEYQEYISFKFLYEKFKNFYEKGMVFENENWYKLNPLWDIATYFQDLINYFLIIKHEGMSGTAKSKAMKLSMNLSFNGKKFLCPTPASFFRYRNNNKSTLAIEEAEKLFGDNKNKNDSDLVEYLNGSYEKGNTVPRQDDKNLDITREFDPAGYTRIGSIKPLKGALNKRSITLRMIKARKGDERGDVEIPSEEDYDYQEARNYAYINGLLNYQEFEKSLKEIKNKYGLSNREWLISKPLIAVAKCVDEKLKEEIGFFLAKLFDIRELDKDEESWDIILTKILLEKTIQKKGDFFISTEELRESLKNKIQKEIFSSRATSTLMSGTGYHDYKTRNKNNTQRGYNLSLKIVLDLTIRNEILSKEEIIKVLKEVSKVSKCPFKEEELANFFMDTSWTDKEKALFVQDFLDTWTGRTLVSGVKEEKIVDSFNKKIQIHITCDHPNCNNHICNEYKGKYYCKEHFEEAQQ